MKVVVIGAVAAGMSTASKLKRNLKDDVDIVVFEKNDEVSFGACGIPFYVSDLIKEPEELIAKSVDDFAKAGINIKIFHEVKAVDPNNKTVTVYDIKNDKSFTEHYDKLVVGTGAGVREFPPFNEKYSNLFSIRNVEDGTKVKKMLKNNSAKNVVIVGGGFIGVEMAEACAHYGANITLVELAPNILTAFDTEFSDALKEEMKQNKVEVLTSTKVISFENDGNKIGSVNIELQDGSVKSINADMVINCAGIKPATDFIDCVDKSFNGAIKVNDSMETSVKDIYSAGDCSIMKSSITGEYLYAPLGTNANKQGRIIADILSGKQPQPFKLIGSSAIKVFGVDGAKVGLSEQEAKNSGISYKVNTITGNSYASYYGTEKLQIKLVYNAETRVILGAQVIGKGVVVQRCNYYAFAIYSKLTVDEIGFMDLCYSPPFGGVWDATLIAGNTAK